MLSYVVNNAKCLQGGATSEGSVLLTFGAYPELHTDHA